MPFAPASSPAPNRSTVRHRVPFYETDAMAVVHHSNYVRYLELARLAWMDEHDRPYREYVAEGLHFTTTAMSLRFLRPAQFDDTVEITTWLDWVRRVTLRMSYEIRRGQELLATAETEHAMVDLQGRPRRIPVERRAGLVRLAGTGDGSAHGRGATGLDSPGDGSLDSSEAPAVEAKGVSRCATVESPEGR